MNQSTPMKTIAEHLKSLGYYSLSLRMPGHGTVPAGLVKSGAAGPTSPGAGATTPAQNVIYAYKATTMNDTHMSHAMEFAYPQTMANCVTCHAGKEMRRVTGSKDAFCEGCHAYAGVKLDCFECHQGRPGPQAKLREARP